MPAAIRRWSLRAFSWVRIMPNLGSVTCRRSGSTRIVPVVNRHDSLARRLDLRRGIPTGLPLRMPCLDLVQLSNAAAALASPVQ